MARNDRCDRPGSWHHVVNRGIAKRPLFEEREDVRYFLSRLAREVRRGRIELHAYCILTTHSHALIRSPRGELSEAMRRSQNEYSRFFNRRHKRDGTLVRGRFLSRPVDSLEYRRNVVRYIDLNPVRARLATSAWDYPWCSAAHYVRGAGPAWLERSWIETWVTEAGMAATFTPAGYMATIGRCPAKGSMRVVEERLDARPFAVDPLDNLVGAAPAAVRAWMERKARLADGTHPGEPVCDGKSIQFILDELKASIGPWTLTPNGRALDGWAVAETGLLRELAGFTIERVSLATDASSSKVRRRLELHSRLMKAEGPYGNRVGIMGAGARGLPWPEGPAHGVSGRSSLQPPEKTAAIGATRYGRGEKI